MTVPPRFHKLIVRDVTKETRDAVSIAFDVPAHLSEAYRFMPGQYLTLKADLAGDSVRRSYSISSGPSDAELRIAIKTVEGGTFSTWANAELQPGHAIDVMTPTGRFGLTRRADGDRVQVGFAAGSGITPILSIVRGALDRADGRFFLFYGNRTSEDVLYRGALEELKDRHLGRLSVFHVLSREEQDVPILNGRLDGEKARILLRAMVPWQIVDDVYICGPEQMIDDLEATCQTLGFDPVRVHSERFVSAHEGKPKPVVTRSDAVGEKYVASLIVDGKRRDVPVADGESILEAALRAGMDLPYACKGGMCSTCRAKVSEGDTSMEVNYSLEPWELKAGFVLTCQARPVSERVVVDFDQV